MPEAPPAATTDMVVDGELVVDLERAVIVLARLESGGDYVAAPDADGGSGAYGYSSDRWRGYAGYDVAADAPASVQDARARADVQRLLVDTDGDLVGAVGRWFVERAEGTTWWEEFPAEQRLSAGLFVERWLRLYAPDGEADAVDTDAAIEVEADDSPAGPVVIDGPVLVDGERDMARSDPRAAPPDPGAHGAGAMRSIAFPVLGPVAYYPGWNDCREVDCSRRHEGVDLVGVRMQPLLAAVDGTITGLGYRGSELAGYGVTIYGDDGWHYNYFHTNNDNPGSDDGQADAVWQFPPGLRPGDRVRAGQIIGYMGDSGNSEFSVPHLHFEIRDPAGAPRDPYWSLQAAERRQMCTIGVGPWSFPIPAPSTAGDGVAYTTVRPLFGDGAWLIDSEGRVTATGAAALIVGSGQQTCVPGPSQPFGTDNRGWR